LQPASSMPTSPTPSSRAKFWQAQPSVAQPSVAQPSVAQPSVAVLLHVPLGGCCPGFQPAALNAVWRKTPGRFYPRPTTLKCIRLNCAPTPFCAPTLRTLELCTHAFLRTHTSHTWIVHPRLFAHPHFAHVNCAPTPFCALTLRTLKLCTMTSCRCSHVLFN
jgi:hypothetical protein